MKNLKKLGYICLAGLSIILANGCDEESDTVRRKILEGRVIPGSEEYSKEQIVSGSLRSNIPSKYSFMVQTKYGKKVINVEDNHKESVMKLIEDNDTVSIKLGISDEYSESIYQVDSDDINIRN